MITQEIAKKFITYNPETGDMTWNHATPDMFDEGVRTKEQKCRMFNARYAGRPALNAINGNGYKAGTMRGKPAISHRVAWLITYGKWPKEIDHINGDRTDNRICNLRSVTARQNGRNLGISKRNRSGVVGVRYNASRGRWEADIRVDGVLKFLGRHKCFGKALNARATAEKAHGFHPNHGKR